MGNNVYDNYCEALRRARRDFSLLQHRLRKSEETLEMGSIQKGKPLGSPGNSTDAATAGRSLGACAYSMPS